MLAWQLLCIFLLLLGCWRVARLCFREEYAIWCAVAFVGALLRLSAAGTGLYIMDEYVTPRSLSTPAALLAISDAIEGNYLRAGVWTLGICVVHPLMSVFVATFLVLLFLVQRRDKLSLPALAAIALPLFPKVTPAYREVLQTRPYFFLTNWAWYEWLGAIAPVGLLWLFARIARTQQWQAIARICRALIVYDLAYLAAAHHGKVRLSIRATGRSDRGSVSDLEMRMDDPKGAR